MAKKKKEKPLGYICGNAESDIRLGAKDMVIYATIKSLKEDRECWKECGIVAVKIDRVIKKGSL